MAGFELVLAVPQSRCSDDLYRQHQIVWSLLANDLRPADSFVYRWSGRPRGAVITARVPRPTRGAARLILPSAGRVTVQMLAGVRESNAGGVYRALADDECAPWFDERMARSGFSIGHVAASPAEWLSGRKMDMNIRIPVRTFTADYALIDPAKAREACMTGVGRGKRFGCGLLMVSRARMSMSSHPPLQAG